MDKKTEALKLALDCVSTLANARDWVGCTPNERWDEDEMYAELCNATICLKKSLSIIQEALAEQPAQQQEPVIDKSAAIRIATALGWAPSKPWVGMTKEERDYIWHTVGNSDAHGDVDGWSGRDVMDAIEAKLREKNT